MGTLPSDLEGLDEVNVVWDFIMDDGAFFHDRLLLIQDSLNTFRKWEITPNFLVIIRGRATKFVANSLAETAFSEDDEQELADIRSVLSGLADAGVRISVCADAIANASIAEDNIAPFVTIEAHAVEVGLALQNKGYAYMRIDAKPG